MTISKLALRSKSAPTPSPEGNRAIAKRSRVFLAEADAGALKGRFFKKLSSIHCVIPAQAGIQTTASQSWIPACAGMTKAALWSKKAKPTPNKGAGKPKFPPASIIAIFSILFFTACSNDTPETQAAPEFTKPSFTDISRDKIESPLEFVDIAEEAGIDFVHENGAFGEKWMPETMGGGGGFLDYDNDGLPDVFLVNGSAWPGKGAGKPKAVSKLYKNLGGGKFEDVTKQTGLDITMYGMGCAFGDFDGDNDLDIYLTAVGSNKLLRNDSGRFTDVTKTMGVSGNNPASGASPAWSASAVWVDVDRDGWLDLFVTNYVKWTPETDLFTTLDGVNKSYATPEQYAGETCRLYRNVNGKRFEDITEKAGVLNEEGKSLGVAVADLNRDGWPDLAVSNDTQPNFLYMNKGDGTFENIALRAGIAFDEAGRARAGMGIDVADVFSKGEQSIVIGNFAREPLSLYTQIGDELFQDRAGAARITKNSLLQLTFGVHFVDLDLDGHLDLLAANGHIEPEINSVQKDVTFEQRPQFFHNNGAGRFVDVSEKAGIDFQQKIVARGIAVADIDNDGDQDVLLTVNAGKPKLLRNDLKKPENWLKLKLEGKEPNHHALGARVTVWSDGQKQERLVRTGSSYLSQSDISTLVFGLGTAAQADSAKIMWSKNGEITSVQSLKSNAGHIIKEK